MILKLFGIFLTTAALAGAAHAAPKPLGNPKAPQGGTMNWNLGTEPTTLNPMAGATEAVTNAVLGHILDTLLRRHMDTNEWLPALAERYDVAKDGKSITYYLRKDAVFSDGKPVTAEDVKFSFDAIFDDAYKAAAIRPYYENFSGVEIVDPHTVRFNIKRRYFGNLEQSATMWILPKHVYGDPAKRMNKTALGSGPMMLEKYDQGRAIILKKNDKWWGYKEPQFQNYYKFDRINYRFIKEENAEMELLKRGDFDMAALSPEQFVLKTEGAPFGVTVFKRKFENSAPKSTPFIGWNLKNDLFKDRAVRLALTHLYDRDTLAKKFMFDMAIPATGPWYQQSEYANPKTRAIPYDPQKARELLKKAGWDDADKNGVLEKMIDGKKREFRFTLLNPNKDYEKWFTVYREELKKAGIDMSIMNIEWNAFQKKMDEKDFDALFLVWGGGSIDVDPKQIWHSASQVKGGSNFISYSNPKVDALIDKAREELDDKKRKAMLREIYDLIAQDVPYTFLTNMKYGFYAYSNKVDMEKPTYKFDVGTRLWWVKSPK